MSVAISEKKCVDISKLPKSAKDEIAQYIKEDNLKIVNSRVKGTDVKSTVYTKYIKRIIDILVSIIAIVISLPLNILIAIITYFDVGRPILFKQTRIGINQKPFIIYKFRNMTNDQDKNGELLSPELRVTKWGKFVRKTSLDELLNFYSILKGDMSIIGPRPLLESYVSRMNDWHLSIYCIKPGLECPSIKKIDHPMSWEEKLDNYVYYVENCSFLVDLKCLFKIFGIAFDRKNNFIRGSAGNGAFLGYNKDGHVIYSKNVPYKYVSMYCQAHGYNDLDHAINIRKSRKSG